MASAYPEFHGRKNEDVEEFLENMEVACISNHVEAPAQMLRLLQICLKGDARTWSKTHEEGLRRANPAVPLTWDNLKEALATQFAKVEDADKVWHEIQGLVQGGGEPIDVYSKKFSSLWERWCRTLVDGIPPEFVKRSMFVNGLLPKLRSKVSLKNPKSFEDALRIAKEKEAKMQKMKEMGLYLDEGAKSAGDLHVNMVKVGRGSTFDLVEKELQRPMQVQRGMYYVPLSFLPGVSKQAKVVEKQVDERNGDVCVKQGVDVVNDLGIDVEVEKKILHVDSQDEGLKPCFESCAGEEMSKDSPLDLHVMAVNDSTVESSSKSHVTSDVDSVDVHANVNVDDDLALKDDEREEDTDVESFDEDSLQSFGRDVYGVETVCSVDVESEKGDLTIMDLLTQLDDIKGVGKTQKEDMHVDLVQKDLLEEDGYDLIDVIEDDLWDLVSLNEEEPNVEMDAHMIESVAKASLHVDEILKRTSTRVDEGFDTPKLEGCESMPVLEELDVHDDVAVMNDVDLWSRQALMDMMLVVAMPFVLKTKIYMVGEALIYGVHQNQVIEENDDLWGDFVEHYQMLDADGLLAHMMDVWYAQMQPLFSMNAGKVDGEGKMFPFDPGG